MRHRVLAIVAVVVLGGAALMLVPGGDRTRVAPAETEPAKTALASVSTPNPELLRRLDREVAAPPPQPASVEPVNVAMAAPAVAPGTAAPAPDLASSSMPAPDPNLKPDSIGPSAVNMRSGPSTSAGTVTVLQPGEAVQVGASSGGWVNVTRADGSSGWVYSSYLASGAVAAPAADNAGSLPTRVASDNQPRAVIRGANGDLADRTARIASRLPAYARPSSGAQSVFTLQPGDEVYIAEVRGNWLRVETEDGLSAWIRR